MERVESTKATVQGTRVSSAEGRRGWISLKAIMRRIHERFPGCGLRDRTVSKVLTGLGFARKHTQRGTCFYLEPGLGCAAEPPAEPPREPTKPAEALPGRTPIYNDWVRLIDMVRRIRRNMPHYKADHRVVRKVLRALGFRTRRRNGVLYFCMSLDVVADLLAQAE